MKIHSLVTDLFSRILVPVFLSVVLIACGPTKQAQTSVTIVPGPTNTPSSLPDTLTPLPPNTPPIISTGLPGDTPKSPSITPTMLGSIQGKVIRASSSGSSPISGASITVSGRPELTTKTNADGFYVLTDLQPGTYTLMASTSSAANSFQVVQVVAGGTVQADFSLITVLPTTPSPIPVSKGEIEGRVTLRGLDGVDRPVEGAPVEVAGWPALTTTTNGNGQYNIRDLQPGQYYLIARTSGTLSSYVPVQVTAGETSVADFPLLSIIPGPPPTIQVKVSVQLNGQPVAGAYVWIEGTKQVFLTNNKGVAKFTYRFNDGRPVIAVYKNRWGFAQAPSNGNFSIDLAQKGTPPPLPKGYKIITPTPGSLFPPPKFKITLQPPVIAPGKISPTATPTAPLPKNLFAIAKP
jgi:hypothetical protein